jgi:hypothetical protein
MIARALAVATTLALTATGVTTTSAQAAGPTINREEDSFTFQDDFLTDQCDVAVSTTVSGFRITREFTGDGTGPSFLATVNFTVTASSGENTYTLKDVGADLLRVQPNGEQILAIIGQIPFDFNGILKLDPVTGTPLQEPRSAFEREVARACAALTA